MAGAPNWLHDCEEENQGAKLIFWIGRIVLRVGTRAVRGKQCKPASPRFDKIKLIPVPETFEVFQGNEDGLYNQLASFRGTIRLYGFGEGKMAKAIHSMIRVLDADRSADFYRRAFGLEVAERIEFDAFTLLYLRNTESDFELELTVNKGRAEPYNLGDGYGHFAVSVSNLDQEHDRFESEGFAPTKLSSLMVANRLFGRFFFVSDPDGYKIEVIERGGRFS